MINFWSKLKHKFCSKYNSIHNLPIYNWNQIHKTSDFGYLLKNYEKVQHDGLNELWIKIYDEYIKEFGLSKEYQNILKLKINIAKQKADYIVTSDRVKLNFIALDEAKLKEIETKEAPDTFRKTLMHIEKSQGVKMNDKQLSVYEFYHYINNING